MNSKMTTNSQLSTNEPKKIKERKTMKTKTKQTEQEQNQRNGHHMEGFQWGRGERRVGETAQGIRNINGRYKTDRGRLRIV